MVRSINRIGGDLDVPDRSRRTESNKETLNRKNVASEAVIAVAKHLALERLNERRLDKSSSSVLTKISNLKLSQKFSLICFPH